MMPIKIRKKLCDTIKILDDFTNQKIYQNWQYRSQGKGENPFSLFIL